MTASVAIGTTRSLTAQFIKLRNDSRRAMGITGTSQDKYVLIARQLLLG
jgi:hypothetical protein